VTYDAVELLTAYVTSHGLAPVWQWSRASTSFTGRVDLLSPFLSTTNKHGILRVVEVGNCAQRYVVVFVNDDHTSSL
jgi:hypothetical protein